MGLEDGTQPNVPAGKQLVIETGPIVIGPLRPPLGGHGAERDNGLVEIRITGAIQGVHAVEAAVLFLQVINEQRPGVFVASACIIGGFVVQADAVQSGLVLHAFGHHGGPLADDGPGFGMKNIEVEADAAAGQIRRPCPWRVIMRRKQKIVSHAKLGRAVQALQHRQRAFA